MEFSLENEIILGSIFRYLSTSDLLTRVALTCPIWNEVAAKFVQQKRQISLNNANILSYVDMLDGGGAPHKYIKFSLDNSFPFNLHKILGEEERIISGLEKFQENIQQLELESSKWENDNIVASNHILTGTEANLFCQILHGAVNVESLSLKFNVASFAITRVEISAILRFTNLQPLHHLKSLEIGVGECGNPYYTKTLLALLSLAPNLEKIHLTTDLSLTGFTTIEAQFPGFIQKIEALFYENCTEEIANFLLSKNFRSLKKLELNLDVDLELYLLVLEKYKDHLENILVDLHVINDERDWAQPVIKLPLMKKLQTLKLVNSCVNLYNPRSVNIQFWNSSETENVFPKLKNIIIELEDAMADISKKYYPMPQEILEQILTATFPELPNHPIFPGLKNIDLHKVRGLENYMFSMNPELCSVVRRYFPNLLCRPEVAPIDFVSTENTNILLE